MNTSDASEVRVGVAALADDGTSASVRSADDDDESARLKQFNVTRNILRKIYKSLKLETY